MVTLTTNTGLWFHAGPIQGQHTHLYNQVVCILQANIARFHAELFMLSRPPQIGADRLVLFYFLEGIEFPTEILLGELSMDKRVTASADVDAARLHVGFVEVFSEPLVAMTASGNQVVEAD